MINLMFKKKIKSNKELNSGGILASSVIHTKALIEPDGDKQE